MDKELSKQARLLLLIIGLFTLGSGFSGIFVNIYLWKLNNSFITISIFNLFEYLFVMLSFPLAGWISKNMDASLTMRISLVLYSVFYLSILVLNVNSIKYIYLLGTLIGVALGFYALSMHVLTYDLTHNGNRDVFYGINGAVASFAGILPPLISGFIIMLFKGLKGYYFIFTITLALFVVTGVLSMLVNGKTGDKDYELMKIFFLKDAGWRAILKGQGLSGIRDGIYSFTINIIIFTILKNEMNFGKYTTFFAFMGLVVFFILSKYIYKENRLKYMLAGSIMMFFAPLLMVLLNNYTGIILYGLINTLFTPFWSIPAGSMQFELIGKAAPKESMRTEFIVLREVPLNLGRIMGILAFIFAMNNFKGNEVFAVMLPLLNLVYIFIYSFYKKACKTKETVFLS